MWSVIIPAEPCDVMSPKLHRIHKKFPGIPAKALEFFDLAYALKDGSELKPRTVMEFAHHIAIPGTTENSTEHPTYHRINLILQRMADLNILTLVRPGSWMGYDTSYLCELTDEQKCGIQSTLDYTVYGFPVIYEELRHSVVPIIHFCGAQERIGSSFLRTRHTLLTAAHCIDKAAGVSIRGVTATQFERATIAIHKNRNLDLAAVRFIEPILPEIKEVELGNAEVLDEVLVLGYPNVPGFTDLLAAERAAISARITGTVGAIASSATEIFAKTSLFLITVRVRGGFSGGPVINSNGLAVGLVSRTPESGDGEAARIMAEYDNLGYGVAIPTEEIIAFLSACNKKDTEVVDFVSGSSIGYREI